MTSAVVAGTGDATREATRVLVAAGFELRATTAPSDAIVVAAGSREVEMLRQLRAIAAAHPGARILVIVPDELSGAAVRRILLTGATGIVQESDVARALVPAVHAVVAGQLTMPAVVAQRLAPRPLSHREKEILALVGRGMTNREIAGKLYLAESTVKTHLASAFRKVDARSRAEAVARIQDPESGFGPGVRAVAERLAV